MAVTPQVPFQTPKECWAGMEASGANSNHMIQIGLETATRTNSDTSVKIKAWLRPAPDLNASRGRLLEDVQAGWKEIVSGTTLPLGHRGRKGCSAQVLFNGSFIFEG